MSETYRVQLQKDTMIFSAAHFITFDGNNCERLHGHNYKVWAEVEAPLDENQYVIDFIYLRDTMQHITFELDHHVLLPAEHPTINVEVGEKEVEATFADRRWIFPKEDCVVLPIANTTAELLARYIGQELLKRMAEDGMSEPVELKIGVDENNGQWAIYRWKA